MNKGLFLCGLFIALFLAAFSFMLKGQLPNALAEIGRAHV